MKCFLWQRCVRITFHAEDKYQTTTNPIRLSSKNKIQSHHQRISHNHFKKVYHVHTVSHTHAKLKRALQTHSISTYTPTHISLTNVTMPNNKPAPSPIDQSNTTPHSNFHKSTSPNYPASIESNHLLASLQIVESHI